MVVVVIVVAAASSSVRCGDHAESSGMWVLGSPLSAVVWQLGPRAWCLLQCLQAKTVSVL